MKYILLTDLEHMEELDDAVYTVLSRSTEGAESPEIKNEIFTDGDRWRIREGKPKEADAIALKDDWVFWNSQTKEFFKYVFRD